MKDYIVGLGEILFDCLPDGKKLADHFGRLTEEMRNGNIRMVM